MDLTAVCMQQNGTAFSAGIINRMIARFENRRSVDNRTASYRGGNDLQTDSAIRRHGCSLELTGGSTTELSATDAWHMAVVGDSDNLHLSTSGVCIELLTRVVAAQQLRLFRPVRQAEANGRLRACTEVPVVSDLIPVVVAPAAGKRGIDQQAVAPLTQDSSRNIAHSSHCRQLASNCAFAASRVAARPSLRRPSGFPRTP